MLTLAATACPDRERAGVEVGAVAEVLEDVLVVRERHLPDPGRALAAHLGEGVGVAVHPRDHVVAADAAAAREPSGTTVEVLCGQPEQ
jgi:hypothetical protein